MQDPKKESNARDTQKRQISVQFFIHLLINRSIKLELAVYVNPENKLLPKLSPPLPSLPFTGGEFGNAISLNLGKFSAAAGSVIIGLIGGSIPFSPISSNLFF